MSDELTTTLTVSAQVAAGLLDSDAYPHRTESINMVETHISWVLLTGPFAYKVKKPVNLGFVDFSTLALRKHFCEEEVRLNRRLAPDLYLGVVAIAGTPAAPKIEVAGPVLEYAVKMHQFDHQQTLDHALNKDRVERLELETFAEELAFFHLNLPPCQVDWQHGSLEVISRAAEQNFDQLGTLPLNAEQLGKLKTLRQWSGSKLVALSDAMRQRKADGWVRECHGDLHSGNIVRLKNRLVAFDCLEFNRDFRWLDVISEVSFLGMDLAARGRDDLAFSLFNRYLETTADYGAATLIDFYRVYYCIVRAKVAALTAAQKHDEHAELVSQPAVSDYLDLATTLTGKPKPQLLITHGMSGSGKTWLTDRLLTALPAIRLRADVIRKSLHGLAATSRSHSGVESGLYTTEATQQTYDHLAKLAGQLLDAGFTVLVDAACLKTWQRKVFQDIAAEHGVAWKILACDAPDSLLRQRIAARQSAGTDASEADLAVLDHQIQTREPFAEAALPYVHRISMTSEQAVDDLVRTLRIDADNHHLAQAGVEIASGAPIL